MPTNVNDIIKKLPKSRQKKIISRAKELSDYFCSNDFISEKFHCNCHKLDHILEIAKQEDLVFFELYLGENNSLLYRFRYAMLCIFGLKSIPSSDIVMDKKELARFKKFVAKL